jgi:hypothetical protein
MTTQFEKAALLASLHVPGQPLVIYNIWDAGSAVAVAAAGARVVGTGSWSVAGAQGYKDGQELPLAVLEQIVARIIASVDLPVTVDFEEPMPKRLTSPPPMSPGWSGLASSASISKIRWLAMASLFTPLRSRLPGLRQSGA